MSYSRAHDDVRALQLDDRRFSDRLTYALLLSVLLHASLLSLTFGGYGFGLPRFGFPWQERRAEGADLLVALVPTQRAAPELAATPSPAPAATPSPDPSQQAQVEQPLSRVPPLPPSAPPAPAAGPFVAGIERKAPQEEAPRAPDTRAKPKSSAATGRAAARKQPRAARSGETASPQVAAPAVIAVPPTEDAASSAQVIPTMPAPAIAEAPSVSVPEPATPSLPDVGDAQRAHIDKETEEQAANEAKVELQRQQEQLEVARQDAAREEAARAESARLEVERRQAARLEAERQEAARIELARAEAIKAEAAKVEAAKLEAAKLEAARPEAAKVEAAKVEVALAEAARISAANAAARAEAARAEAARAEAARAEAARAEAARAEAARAEAARAEAARAEAAKQEEAAEREERLRAIGRQLDEGRARREAAAKLAPTTSSLRRYRLFGRADSNQEIILYAEAWARKIQLNMTMEMIRKIADQPHTEPMVTVALRSDGSVESITFVRSSGVIAIDEAIRTVIESQTPYQAFPPNLAREYDVLEIRRTWHFDTAIRLD